jgi:hypothetical protein
VEPDPSGGGGQLHLDVGQDPVIAKPAAEQAGGHDGHALGVQATAMDVGAMDADEGGVWVSSRRPTASACQRTVARCSAHRGC